LAMNGPIAFSYVFHSIVTCVLNHHMRAMLRLGAELDAAKEGPGEDTMRSAALASITRKGMEKINTDVAPVTTSYSNDFYDPQVPSPSVTRSPAIFDEPEIDDLESVTSESPHRSAQLNLGSFGLPSDEPVSPTAAMPLISPPNVSKSRSPPLLRVVTDGRNSPRQLRSSPQPPSSPGSILLPGPIRSDSPARSPIPLHIQTNLERPQSTYSMLFSATMESQQNSPNPSVQSFNPWSNSEK
jgi:hypothetical protein